MTIGADIDGRIIRGEGEITACWSSTNEFFIIHSRVGKQSNVVSNFEQYHLLDKLVCLVVGDNAHPAWRDGVLFDAIVADRKYN